ncbi:hypothetical protein C8F01DRAFT_1076804 [Mycena amicta]|nr:hypothetical protein C8F01DRAFT_1076804 [Mycena amicta]
MIFRGARAALLGRELRLLLLRGVMGLAVELDRDCGIMWQAIHLLRVLGTGVEILNGNAHLIVPRHGSLMALVGWVLEHNKEYSTVTWLSPTSEKVINSRAQELNMLIDDWKPEKPEVDPR